MCVAVTERSKLELQQFPDLCPRANSYFVIGHCRLEAVLAHAPIVTWRSGSVEKLHSPSLTVAGSAAHLVRILPQFRVPSLHWYFLPITKSVCSVRFPHLTRKTLS